MFSINLSISHLLFQICRCRLSTEHFIYLPCADHEYLSAVSINSNRLQQAGDDLEQKPDTVNVVDTRWKSGFIQPTSKNCTHLNKSKRECQRRTCTADNPLPLPHSLLHYLAQYPVLFACCLADMKGSRKVSQSGAEEQFTSYRLISTLATAIMFIIPL